jgi:hypothetical protein
MEPQEIARSLTGFRKDDLLELMTFFNCGGVSGLDTNKDIIDYLTKERLPDLTTFLNNYDKLRRLNISKAIDILSEEIQKIREEDTQGITDRKGLILLIYRQNRADLIPTIVFNCKLFYTEKVKNEYRIKLDKPIKSLNLQLTIDAISQFFDTWNAKYARKLSFDIKSSGNSDLSIAFLVEKNKRPVSWFKFREEEGLSYSVQGGLELGTKSIYPVFSKLLNITKIDDSNLLIRLDFKHENERWFNYFIEATFGKVRMLPAGEEEIKKVYGTLTDLPEYSVKAINTEVRNLKDNLVSRIRREPNLPKDKKGEYEQIAESMSYGGLTFKNDARTTTRNMEWSVTDVEKAGKVLTVFERLLEEVHEKIPESKDSFFININGKSVMVTEKEIRPMSNLKQDELKVLKMFFGIE